MVCVLRVGGSKLDLAAVKKALGLEPYRIDAPGERGAKAVCLYFDVASGGNPGETVSDVEKFLSVHADRLAALSRLEGVEFRNLDIGIMLYESMASVSIELGETLLRKLSELRLSLSISTYPADSRS